MTVRSLACVAFPALFSFGFLLAQSGENCTFRSDPDEFLAKGARLRRQVHERTAKLQAALADANPRSVAPSEIPRRNFIDVAIFDKLEQAGSRAARLTTDDEFVRRIHLDLTGRAPSPAAIRAFLADANPGKRDALIDSLLYSPEFIDRWTMWLGDLTQNTRSAFNVSSQIDGRNAMYGYLRAAVANETSLRDIAFDLVVSKGNDYDYGPANFTVRSWLGNGPRQDSYDLAMVRATNIFLGLGHYDCLACHDGRRHLDSLSLWGQGLTRLDAYQMSAHFSRINYTFLTNVTLRDIGNRYYNSTEVQDRTTGAYDLNTTTGNRPNRARIGTIASTNPVYRNGAAPAANADWRGFFATQLVNDPMFARNMANRLWKQVFNLGLVEPVDQLDPARLDPKNPPPDSWGFQATHPELLEKLAAEFASNNYSLREMLRLLVSSSAYQLSTRFDGDWSLAQMALFARHYPRRLDAEEVHDAVIQSTGVTPQYTVQGWAERVRFAMKLPDINEPSNDGNAVNFLNTFLRGNRDTQPRSQAGSMLQQLTMMNSPFIMDKMHVTQSPALQAIAKLAANDALVDEMYLTFLSRKPSDAERAKAVAPLARATTAATRNTAIEDLAWVLLNRVEFLFSY